MDDEFGFAVATLRNEGTRTVVIGGVGVVIQRCGVGASVYRLICAVAVPDNPGIPTFGFAGVVVRDVVAGEVIVCTHRIVHLFAFTWIQAVPIVDVGVRVVVHGFRIHATIHRDENFASLGIDPDGVRGLELAFLEGVRRGLVA